MRVILLPDVMDYLEELAEVLHEKEYLSFEETALTYVLALYDDIMTNLPLRAKRPAPNFFSDRYGKGLYYAAFPKNKRTTWYVFFVTYCQNGEVIYQVRYITNSHVVAQHL